MAIEGHGVVKLVPIEVQGMCGHAGLPLEGSASPQQESRLGGM